jgi:hypothetical protein
VARWHIDAELRKMLCSDVVRERMGCAYLWLGIGGAGAHESGCGGKLDAVHIEQATSFTVNGAQGGTRKSSDKDVVRYLQEFREKGHIVYVGGTADPADAAQGQWRTCCCTATSEISTDLPDDTSERRSEARVACQQARILVEPGEMKNGKLKSKSQGRSLRKAGANFSYRISILNKKMARRALLYKPHCLTNYAHSQLLNGLFSLALCFDA